MTEKRKPRPSVRMPNVAIIVSRYNATITDKLLEGAIAAYTERGGNAGDIAVFSAPGAFELPTLAMCAASTGRYTGIVALGCVIKGETRHDQYISKAICEGLVNVSIITHVPVSLGVLTTDNVKQAKDRAGGRHGNKGHEAMTAVLETILTLSEIESDVALRGERAIVRDKAARKPAPRARVAVGGKR